MIGIWWKSYVLSLTTDSSCVTSTIYTHKKFSKLFIQTAWSWKMATMNHVSVVLPCGATVGFDLCCYLVCARGELLVFFTGMERSRSNTWILFTQTCMWEREKKNEYFESKCKHFNVFCCCYWNVLCKENSNKVLWNWHQVKVTQVKREHKTHPLSDQLKCQGPQREQRPNSINVNFNPSDAVRNHAGLSCLDTTTWNNPMRRATNHLKRKSEFVLPYFWLSDPLYSFLRPRTTHLFSLHAIQICFSGLYFESQL